ncbi:hypothetical protein BC830DRAFT_1128170, partial [Chytriomyces sp. MP71]
CLSLQGSICSEFADYKAYIPAGSTISSITSFDNYVQQSYGPGFKDLVTRSSNGGYKCSGWNGENLRYMHSVVCAYHVGLGFAYGATGSSTPCNFNVPRPFPLCASSFDAFSSSWDAIMNDHALCPAGVSVDSLNYKSLLMTAKALASADAACLAGVLEENNDCGFQTAGEAAAYCASPSNANGNACCAQFLPSPALATTNSVAMVTPPMASIEASTGHVALPSTSNPAITTQISSKITTGPSDGDVSIVPLPSTQGSVANLESPSKRRLQM